MRISDWSSDVCSSDLVVRENAGRIWVLDPIDGTRSFIAGRTIFGTLIALMQDGWPTIGIIDQPISGERWCCLTGQPTLLNGKQISTCTCDALDEDILATHGQTYFCRCEGEHVSFLAGQCRDTGWGAECEHIAPNDRR